VSDQPDDDQLRDLVQSRDPAASLPPADPDRVARLLEGTMTHDVETPAPDHSRPKADPRRRTPLTWLVAAAAVLVIAGVGAFAIFGGDREPQRVPDAVDERVTTLELAAGPPVGGRCAMVSADRLAFQETAFEGTVTTIKGRAVTLRVDHWYRGGDTDYVTVAGPADHLRALVQSVTFERDGRYLVTASGGEVSVCGYSAPYSDDLAALYAEAFAS
jgi:hypothetical protein